MGISIDGNALDSQHYYKDGKAVGGAQAAAAKPQGLFSEGGPSFKDALDTVNPLQQLPVVGSLYRAASGDTISPAAKIAGGALFGGPIGAALAVADSLFGMITGKDAGSTAMDAVAGASAPPPPGMSQQEATDLAAAQPATTDAIAGNTNAAIPLARDGTNSSVAAALYARQEKAYGGGQLVEGMYNRALELRV